MEFKRIGASLATAALVAFPLAACGSSTPVVTTVTATPTALTPCPPVNDPSWEKCFDDHRAQRERDAAAKQQQPSAPKPTNSGLPWWAWTLIVPAGLIGVLVLAYKLSEANDERTISRAQARVAELDARPRPVLDYDDFEDEYDELPEDDMAFLHRVTDPAPSAPAAGNLLSSLRQQGGA
ncbi:Uncharacterised protein [Mycobacteroides abscessus]|uniref:hypothetical protein n=1 Tax=Mycobacteroides abscessus TaxID=36809 RepID=UPI0005DE56A5|nr:hypothetical protein [Mycobacteroides abscessus]MBE5505804.1 hypothetical protein [Mycobacteroides abscessus]MDO2989393.1 hypothetical protein [Mycobacteroides abscessus subsp. massiliense]MDO3053337.1 hypothetical protein [Mycobacteroides abscessus subsp. massiliense]PVB14797.1 hypothetical protein DDJ68_13090 [Mycobacteroides abscessus]RIR93506.1 hypothetical protein D2E57_13370 [Mycobacteroides abscessus]